ncbi:hypothetical protein [Microbacterium enclense]|uniref:hypothetical protein n=1 Tax=Microbacterium enclense TaxID=993073 RepID=UPI003F7DD73C
MEDKALLSTHLADLADRVATLPFDEQAEQTIQLLRPLALAVEQATLAIARLRLALSRTSDHVA